MAFHCKILKYPMIFWQNVEESCTFQKIHGAGKVEIQTKWSGRLVKNKVSRKLISGFTQEQVTADGMIMVSELY
jgi:hypothetical protein